MKCPVDGNELRMMDRQGVEIDYCPQCRGIWLDRGELDKLIERSTASEPSAPEYYRRDDDDDDDYERGRRREWSGHPEQHKYRKKESFWSKIFDFD